jgi:hypothetical protein
VFQIRVLSGIRRALTGAPPCGRESVWRRLISSLATPRCLITMTCLAVFLPVALSDAGIGQNHSTAKLDVVYRATLLGFPIGSITWAIDMRDDRYSASASGSTAGLLRIFAQGHGTASAHGAVAGQRLAASNFMVSITHGSASEEIKIAFSGGRARESLAPAPAPNPNLVPLTDAYRAGVLDPMTALLIHVPGNGDTAVPAACERKIAVFDGRMRKSARTRVIKVPLWSAASLFCRWRAMILTAMPSNICRTNAIWKYGWRPSLARGSWCRSGSRCRRR